MARTEIGDRIGAILCMNKEEVELLGYGVYDGMFVAPRGPFGISWEEFEQAVLEVMGEQEFKKRKENGTLRIKNPRMTLDDGSVVWGQECWWGPEGRVKEMLADLEADGVSINTVNIDDARAKAYTNG